MHSLVTLALSLGVLMVVATWLTAYLLIANDRFGTPSQMLPTKTSPSDSQNDARELAAQSH